MTVIIKPIAGVLQVRKYLPLQFVPLTIELSLVDNATYPIIYTSETRPGGPVAGTVYTDVTSNSWSILNVQATCELVTLDNSFEEEFIKSLSEGKPLSINYNTLISHMQTITGNTNLHVNIS
ncbi:MAG: hypothetical protein ACKPKO_35945, partial [Candidatus Fonsibacter sp.]